MASGDPIYVDSSDGGVGNNHSTWSGTHDANTGDSLDDTSTSVSIGTQYVAILDFSIVRGFFPFDTTGLPEGITITAATFKAYVGWYHGVTENDTFRLVETSQATKDDLIVEDFNQCGSIDDPTALAPDQQIDFADWLSWITWTMNSTGRDTINTDDWTLLGIREVDWDAEDDPCPYEESEFVWLMTDESDTEPELTVTYTEAEDINMKINIGDAWKEVEGMKINVGDAWKEVEGAKVNIGDSWKEIF